MKLFHSENFSHGFSKEIPLQLKKFQNMNFKNSSFLRTALFEDLKELPHLFISFSFVSWLFGYCRLFVFFSHRISQSFISIMQFDGKLFNNLFKLDVIYIPCIFQRNRHGNGWSMLENKFFNTTERGLKRSQHLNWINEK